LQRWWRGTIFLYKFRKYRKAIVVLQKGFRYLQLKKQFAKYAKVILIIQKTIRGHFGRQKVCALRLIRRQNQAAAILQRVQRGQISRKKTKILAEKHRVYLAEKEERERLELLEREDRARRAAQLQQEQREEEASTILQKQIRGKLARAQYARWLRACEKIISVVRMFISSCRYKLQRKACVQIQAVCRQYLCQKTIVRVRNAGLRIVRCVASYWLRQKLLEWTIEVHSAAAEGDVEFLCTLLNITSNEEYKSLGFNSTQASNSRSMDGGEPLLSVAATNENGDVHVVQELISRGATFDSITPKKNYWVCTAYDTTNPFEKCILMGDDHIEISKMLHEYSTDPIQLMKLEVDDRGHTLLDMIVEMEISNADTPMFSETIAWLMECQAATVKYGTYEVIQAALDAKHAETRRFQLAKEEAEKRRQHQLKILREQDPLYQLMSQDHDNTTERERIAKWRAEQLKKEEEAEQLQQEKEEKKRLAWTNASKVTRRSTYLAPLTEKETAAEREEVGEDRRLRATLSGGSFDLIEEEENDIKEDKDKDSEEGTTRWTSSRLSLHTDDGADLRRQAREALRKQKAQRWSSTKSSTESSSNTNSSSSPEHQAELDAAHQRLQRRAPTLRQACSVALPAVRRALAQTIGLAAAANGVNDGWYYKDETSNEQGPFTSMQMASWAAGGHFPDSLHVRRGGPPSSETTIYYTTIASLFPKTDQDHEAEAFIATPVNDVTDAIAALNKVLALMDEEVTDASYNN
jgi:hypothetical protein